MDVLVERKDGDLRTSIYRKPTFTGLYTRWDSFFHKSGLIKSLTPRGHNICSPCMLPLEIFKLKSIFADNRYPTLVVDRVIRETLERRFGDSKRKAEKSTSPSVTICLPWIGHSSTTLGKEIRQAITKGYTRKSLPGRSSRLTRCSLFFFFFFFFLVLLDLNQAVPNHLADEDGPVVYPANAFDSRLRGD